METKPGKKGISLNCEQYQKLKTLISEIDQKLPWLIFEVIPFYVRINSYSWIYVKPNYYQKQCPMSSFLFTQGNNDAGPNWPEVPSRLVLCIYEMELASWVLDCHFGHVFITLAWVRKMRTKNIASWNNLALVPFSCSVKESRILPACLFNLVLLHTTGPNVLYF